MRPTRQKLLTFGAGIVFALGLGIAGMTSPSKFIAFLDVTGAWDPSLALVMMGAIGAHVLVAQWAKKAPRPLWADVFVLPIRADLDARLVVGAALFGLGWGTAGYCPGPALVSLVGLSTGSLAFCAAMVVGVMAFNAFAAPRPPAGRAANASTTAMNAFNS